MHSTAQPKVVTDNCIGCKICQNHCAHDAIHIEDKKAVINYDNCVGCGQCVALCPKEAAVNGSEESSKILNYKIVEYTEAVLKEKQHFHIAFIMNVSPECDCWAHNDAAIVPDLGMACSMDPVALDQACVDMVNRAPKLETPSLLNDKCKCSEHEHEHHDHDKFRLLHPDTDWEAGLNYAEQRGLGTRAYELVTL